MNPYTVFISRKSADAGMAKVIYTFLKKHDIQAYDSDISLHEIGITEYQSTIDSILDKAEHLIIIGITIQSIKSNLSKLNSSAIKFLKPWQKLLNSIIKKKPFIFKKSTNLFRII
jgi:hypothetical protein